MSNLDDGLVRLLFPQFDGVEVESISLRGKTIRVTARPTAPSAICPACQTVSRRTHSRYERRLADAAAGGRELVIHLRARRFLCSNRGCDQRTFAEQVPGLTFRHGRRSLLQRGLLERLAIALGGRPGARLAEQLAVPVHASTLIRLIRAIPLPQRPTPRVLGVDEFAVRRGHTYNTILIDIETSQPVDVLPDREAETFAAWLTAHPGVEVICRDRAGYFADGASRAAGHAVQVADRWHLIHNLGKAVESAVKRHRQHLRPDPPKVEITPQASTQADGPRAQRTRARHAEIHALVAKGWRPWQIAQALGLERTTIRKYARAATADELITATAPRHSRLLEPYKPHLRRRTAEGCISTKTLLAEIRAQGFKGSERTLRRWLIKLRGAIAEPETPKPVKVRDFVAWIMRPHEKLTDEERLELKRICAIDTELAATRDLARRFTVLLRERRGQELETWATDAENGPVREIATFAAGLRKDWKAVVAGLTLPYSSGKVEGRVNKMLKRNMFGRANHQLLRQRILLNA